MSDLDDRNEKDGGRTESLDMSDLHDEDGDDVDIKHILDSIEEGGDEEDVKVKQIVAGDNVKIQNLVKAAKFNGRVGIILNYVESESRYRVRLGGVSGEILKVKEKNLERIMTVPPSSSSPLKKTIDLPDSPTSFEKSKTPPSPPPPSSPSSSSSSKDMSTTTTLPTNKTTTTTSTSVKDKLAGFVVKSKRTASKLSFFGNKLSILSGNAFGRTRINSMDSDTIARVKALKVFRKTLKDYDTQIRKFRSSVQAMKNKTPRATKHVPRPRQGLDMIIDTYDDFLKEIDEVLLEKTNQHLFRLGKLFDNFKYREVLSNDLKAAIKDLSFLRKHSKRFQGSEINTQSDKVSKLQNEYDTLERTYIFLIFFCVYFCLFIFAHSLTHTLNLIRSRTTTTTTTTGTLRNDVEDLSSSAGNVLHAIFRMFRDAQLRFFEAITKVTKEMDLDDLPIDAEEEKIKEEEEKQKVEEIKALPDGDDI